MSRFPGVCATEGQVTELLLARKSDEELLLSVTSNQQGRYQNMETPRDNFVRNSANSTVTFGEGYFEWKGTPMHSRVQ